LFSFHIIVKIRINRHTRAKTLLYKLIYRGIFYHTFFLFRCERSFETASFCLKFWLFSSCRPRKLVLLIFSKSKRPFEKQTTPRLVTNTYLWTRYERNLIFDHGHRLLDIYRHYLLMTLNSSLVLLLYGTVNGELKILQNCSKNCFQGKSTTTYCTTGKVIQCLFKIDLYTNLAIYLYRSSKQ